MQKNIRKPARHSGLGGYSNRNNIESINYQFESGKVDDDSKTVDKTLDCLPPDERQLVMDLLNKLTCPGFPLDKRCINILHKHKGVKIKSTPGMYLADSKLTFPISEHLSPQDFLLQAGFSAFQAFSVCENKRIKCKLTAAITEARVWLNRMTKNQALLLYALSVKMITNNMPPLFLQLTEAISNNRIVNMMELFEYLRVLKLIGKLPLQSKFQDEKIIENHILLIQRKQDN